MNEKTVKQDENQPESENLKVDNTLDTIADTLAEELPDVQQHAIDAEAEKQNQAENEYSDLVDVKGNRGFNPEIHKADKDGKPILTSKGKLSMKPKPRSYYRDSRKNGVVNNKAADKLAAELKHQSRASGAMAANLLIVMGVSIGGDEWRPRADAGTGMDEKALLENSFADYFEATGKTDLPPAMALTVAIGAYALPRFTMPKTQKRVSTFREKIKIWFANRKLKAHGLEAKVKAEQQATKSENNAHNFEA